MLTEEIILQILAILKEHGCSETYLFGSNALGIADEYSDIEIGVKGLAAQKFFFVHSLLEDITQKPVDLVDFDEKEKFFSMLERLGELKRIG